MNLDLARRLAEIEASKEQLQRLINAGAKAEELGAQAGYLAALFRQLADWYRER